MLEAEMECAEPAHREADDVGLGDAEVVEDGDRVGDRALLRVRRLVDGDVRRRVAAGGVGDAAVPRGKGSHLRLPAAVVAGELVDEQEGKARADAFDVQADSVVGTRELGDAI
jgi:hypothetical protein